VSGARDGAAEEAPAAQASPTVSVVVPVYRVARVIAGCIDTIAAQDHRPLEVIVVDDCGGDESTELAVAALTRHGLEHRLVRHAANRGLGAARNSGLAAARGDYVWFLDADDRAVPRILSTLIAAAQRHSADVAVCRTLRVRPDGAPLGVDEAPWHAKALTGPEAARQLLRNGIRAYSGSKILRRGALPERMFDEGRAYEDFRPVLVLFLGVETVALVDEPLFRYTRTAGSISDRFAPHTTDLFDVAADVRGVLDLARDSVGADAGAVARGWDDAYLEYLYLNAVLPVANLALRAEHAGRADGATRAAVRRSRSAIKPRDVLRLTATGRYRLAASAAVLKASPRSYSRVLARR
jgi:glycosyltransferase involved in cell wall biosynthesis